MIRRRFFQHENRRDSVPRAVDEELEFHLSTRVDALVKEGWSETEARREAERQFGNVDGVRGSCIAFDHERERATSRSNLLSEIGADFHYALRLLRRNYAFAFVAIVMLSLGIGANTAIFTLVNAVLLRNLPVPHAEQLLAIGDPAAVSSMSQGDARSDLISYPMYRALQSDSLLGGGLLASGMAPRLNVRVNAGGGEVEHPRARFVSANYFHVLGVAAAHGHAFDPRDEVMVSALPTIVLSHAYWTRRFSANPAVIGRSVVINGTGFTIVGVMPEKFSGDVVGQPQDFWLPIAMQPVVTPQQPLLDNAKASWLLLLQRIPSTLTPQQATSSLTTRIRAWLRDHNADVVAKGEVFISSGERGFSQTRKSMAAPLALLMAGGALLTLLVCANVANLLLARAVARGREMSVRLALGASRFRLIRQLITESSLLAIGGALGGVFVAWSGVRLMTTLAGESEPASVDFTLDPVVLLFAAGVALVSVMFFGLVPALRASQVNLALAMRGNIGWERGRRGAFGIGRVGLNQALVAGQVALSLVLITSAGLLSRDLARLERTNTGIDQAHLVTIDVDAGGYNGVRFNTLAELLRTQFSEERDVAAVTYSESGLFSGRSSSISISIPGFMSQNTDGISAGFDVVGPNYLTTIRARVVAGRDISERDVLGGERVALVNETFAQAYFAGKDALNATFSSGETVFRIVGVVADIKDNSLNGPPTPRFYEAYQQNTSESPRPLMVIVRSANTAEPTRMSPLLRSAVRRIDGSLDIAGIASVAERMEHSLGGERLLMRLALVFGALALVLAAIGLYGVMSYAVSRRTNEIGLRMALGANRLAVVRMILLDAMRLVLIGAAVGLPVSLGLARLLGSQLHGVGTVDLPSVVGAVLLLGASAALAALVPALRASRVAPVRAINLAP